MIDYKQKYNKLIEDTIAILGQILGECDLSQTDGLEVIVERFYNDLIDNKDDFDPYIVFLLGSDDFNVSQEIRKLGLNCGIDIAYDRTIYLAKKFNEYNKNKYGTLTQYDSFICFLDTYYTNIIDYIENGKEFEI